jgi:hypothetical protein
MVVEGQGPAYRQDNKGMPGASRSGTAPVIWTKRVIAKMYTSTDVNDYLKEIKGKNITAKDFRTWAGTVLAAMALNELESFDSAAQAKRNLRAAIEKVAGRLWQHCYDLPQTMCIRKC